MLQRIRNGTTTERDAEIVENLMASHSSKSLRLMVVKVILALFLIGGFLLGLSIGGLFF